MPVLSVVVPTFNRAGILPKTLGHLERQTLPRGDFEVIVVDDGSSDGTGSVVRAAIARGTLDLHYLHHDNHGPGYSQNRGIREARAPLVLLIADDILLDSGALEAHVEAHRRDPSPSLAVLGRVLQSPELTQSVFLATWDPFRLSGIPDGTVLPWHMFWACNISFQRDFMLRHGMFRDEMGRAGPASHEDVEVGYKLRPHGLRVVFSSAAFAHHYHVETLEGTVRRFYQRGRNWPDFRERVPRLEVDLRYRVYGPRTLLRNRAAISSESGADLLPSERSLARLAAAWVLRGVAFNRLTVAALWLPFFAAVERLPFLRPLMNDNMYRGVFLHYFLRGCREGPGAAGGREG